jgi:hypothetical protein
VCHPCPSNGDAGWRSRPILRWGSRSRWATTRPGTQLAVSVWWVGVGTGAGYAGRHRTGVDPPRSLHKLPTLTCVASRFLARAPAGLRLDEVEVIGRNLALHVTGLSMRNVAEQLAVPRTTAREWRRRFQLRAPALAAALVAVAVHLDPAAVVLSTNGEAAALEVLGAAWQRARTRFGEGAPAVWRFWSLISGGQAVGTNRSPPATQPQALLARSPAQHAGRPPLLSSPSRSLFLRASDPLMSALDLPHQM